MKCENVESGRHPTQGGSAPHLGIKPQETNSKCQLKLEAISAKSEKQNDKLKTINF